MIAMQYGFVLPADYDMSIIDRRIAERGGFTDGLPGLVFKAYLSSRTGQAGGENSYAPFYLWSAAAGMNDFLAGPGFVAVSQSFGWPAVKTWSVWHAELAGYLGAARFATRHVEPIAPYAGIEALRAAESAHARQCVQQHGAVAAVAGFEPTTWTLVRFQLWKEMPPDIPGVTVYTVGHMSLAANGTA